MGDDTAVYVELVGKVALFLGVLGIGVALGASLGLSELQTSCMAAGKLPASGSFLMPGQLNDNACWEGAQFMQSVANTAGYLGAGLLLGGGVLDRYEDRVVEVVA